LLAPNRVNWKMIHQPSPSDHNGQSYYRRVSRLARAAGVKIFCGWIAALLVMLTACPRHQDRPRAPYIPLANLEAEFGPLITAGNHPTADQNGTGERLGLFRDANGTIWGLPLTITTDGAVLGCASPSLRDSQVTDNVPAGATLIGATNAPTGWRGGTGKLELLLRDTHGNVHWREVKGGYSNSGPACWDKGPADMARPLPYYRLAPIGGER
jgi:hypothetical protein